MLNRKKKPYPHLWRVGNDFLFSQEKKEGGGKKKEESTTDNNYKNSNFDFFFFLLIYWEYGKISRNYFSDSFLNSKQYLYIFQK